MPALRQLFAVGAGVLHCVTLLCLLPFTSARRPHIVFVIADGAC